MSLDRGFNDKSIGTKYTTFHGRDEEISHLGSCNPMKTYINKEGFLTFKPSIEDLKIHRLRDFK
jgi:hypothetical protein